MECRKCGQSFSARRPWQAYCSPTCRATFHHEGRPVGNVKCLQCGTEFNQVRPWQGFCSTTCQQNNSRTRRKHAQQNQGS